ncbi:unnamed protein product [Agarophyton chilense]|eukprot:gb/GEZJ01000751.1/.p1 GENE.gb/GEZJ01000751.1/~~gb/GEZJ01000751.1/.p1  ORF type:complete len:1107 (-),score=138.96 gb/GEZJ01000751.1/:2447-5767(-)
MGAFQPNRRKRDRPLPQNAPRRHTSRAATTQTALPTPSSSASGSSATPVPAVATSVPSVPNPIARLPPLRSVPPPPPPSTTTPFAPAESVTPAPTPRTPAFHPAATPHLLNNQPGSRNDNTTSVIHRTSFSPMFVPSPQIDGLREMFELLKFLQEANRMECLQNFVSESWKLYNAKYRKKRNRNEVAPSSNGHNSNSPKRTPDQIPFRSSNIQEKPSNAPNTPALVVCLDDNDEKLSTPQIDANAHHLEEHYRPAQSQAPTPCTQPRATPRSEVRPRLPDPTSLLKDRRYTKRYSKERQDQVRELVEKRFRCFSSKTRRPEQRFSQEDRMYNLWKPSDPSEPTVRLHEDLLSGCFREEDGQVYEIHLEALRFLWYYLVENPCSGAVFVHGLGYPRAHLLFGFADLLVGKNSVKQNFRMLVLCPDECLYEWEWARECFDKFVQVRILGIQSCFEATDEWQERGGLLICSFSTFMFMTEHENPALQTRSREVFCNPGPDLFVLDEATRLGMLVQRMRTTLREIRTSARLAMTSVPLSSNFARAWSVIDWACPRFLGPCWSFWNAFVKPLTDAATAKRQLMSNDEVLQIDRCLRRNLGLVSFGPSFVMREETLFNSARYTQESVIHVHMHKEHRVEYRKLLKSFATAIREKACSPVVAAHLLSIFASVGVAALSSVQEECKEQGRQRDYGVKTVFGGGPFHVSFLRSVLPILENSCLNSMPWAKLDALRFIAGTCMADNERLVVFVFSESLSEEVFLNLRRDPTLKGKPVHRLDMNEKPSKRKEVLQEFNTTNNGTVLIAPYGPNIDLMEGAGWCFVNATRIVFMNAIWHSASYVQAVNRVHNFAQRNSTVYIHHIVAADSVEEALCKSKLSSDPFAEEEHTQNPREEVSKEVLMALKYLPKLSMRFFDEISLRPKLADRAQAKLDQRGELLEQWRDHFNFLTPLTHVRVEVGTGHGDQGEAFLVQAIDIDKGLYQSSAAGLDGNLCEADIASASCDVELLLDNKKASMLYEQRLRLIELAELIEIDYTEFDRKHNRAMSLHGNEAFFETEIDTRNDIRSSWVEYCRLYENIDRASEHPPCHSENGFVGRKRKRSDYELDSGSSMPRRF